MVEQLQPNPQADAKLTTPKTYKKPEETLIGQEISGCIILEKVSEGGMGTVFKAKHKALDRIVCVKILSPALSEDKKAVGLFLTEARAIAEIDHPNIVFVYNVGREKGFYFIVMSFIEGESLSAIVRKRPNLPVSFVIETFIGILQGLEAAHQKGIIHRDIKPSNILINKKLEPKIVDFGIAKKVDKDKGNTKTTELAGTAYFLSPEQALGRAIDTRADLYSVGASLYYVLTSKYPFTGKNSMDIIQKHINEPVPDVLALRKNIPAWLGLAVSKLMSKNPNDRFQTATDTLNYFKKMRADDQLKVSGGVNITEEVGLRVNLRELGGAPILNDAIKRLSNNRFNMKVDSASAITKPSVDVVSLGTRSAGAIAAQAQDTKSHASTAHVLDNAMPDKTFTQKFIEQRKTQFSTSSFNKDLDPSKALRAQKNKFLFSGFLYTILASSMMAMAAALFIHIGALAAKVLSVGGASFVDTLRAPWLSGSFITDNMLVVSVGFVFIVFTISMLFFDIIRRSVFLVLFIALTSYAAALFGLITPDNMALDMFNYNTLPLFAILFGALAINIDSSDCFPILARFLSAFLFALGFFSVYLFTRPDNFLTGPLTTSLSYSALGLVAATLVSVFIRGSFIFRFAGVVLFVIGSAAIWTYQASGNTYYTLKQIENYTPPAVIEQTLDTAPAEPMPSPQPAIAEALPAVQEKPVLTEYKTTGVQVNVLSQPSATASVDDVEYEPTPPVKAAEPSPQVVTQPVQEPEPVVQEAILAVPATPPAAIAIEAPTVVLKPVVKEPQRSPQEQRALFLPLISKQLKDKTKTQQLVESQIWGFSLREPYEKFKYTYKDYNIVFMAIVLMIVYGIFAFIISVLVIREERWNLI